MANMDYSSNMGNVFKFLETMKINYEKKSDSALFNIDPVDEENIAISYVVEVNPKEPCLLPPMYLGSKGINKAGDPVLYEYHVVSLAMEFNTVQEAKETIDFYVKATGFTNKKFTIKRIRQCISNSGIEYNSPAARKLMKRYVYGLLDIEKGKIVNSMLEDRNSEKEIPDSISYDPSSGLCLVHVKTEEFTEDLSYVKEIFKNKSSLCDHILSVALGEDEETE